MSATPIARYPPLAPFLVPAAAAASAGTGRGWVDPLLQPPQCPVPSHNPLAVIVAVFLLLGIVISFLPQQYRIISTKSSEGFSPLFLLLGACATTCALLNIVLLQWGLFGCCRTAFTTGDCIESLLGVAQVGAQWAMFISIVVLYMVYFPEHKKRVRYTATEGPTDSPLSTEWKMSMGVVAVLIAHLLLSALVSAFCLWHYGIGSEGVAWLAGLSGLLSMGLSTVQFLPQLYWTWKARTVGALSIPMMMMQTPGAFLFAYTISIRPGTNWTSWITYVVAGILQGMLLALCVTWKLKGHAALRLPEDVDYAGNGDERGPLSRVLLDPARDLAAIMRASLANSPNGVAEDRRPLLTGRTGRLGRRAASAASGSGAGSVLSPPSTQPTGKRPRSTSPILIEDDTGL